MLAAIHGPRVLPGMVKDDEQGGQSADAVEVGEMYARRRHALGRWGVLHNGSRIEISVPEL